MRLGARKGDSSADGTEEEGERERELWIAQGLPLFEQKEREKGELAAVDNTCNTQTWMQVCRRCSGGSLALRSPTARKGGGRSERLGGQAGERLGSEIAGLSI